MNVRELIEKLRSFDPETRVLALGYEDGFDDATIVKEITVMRRKELEPVERKDDLHDCSWDHERECWEWEGEYVESPQGKIAVLIKNPCRGQR